MVPARRAENNLCVIHRDIDFIVQAEADNHQIRMRFRGARTVALSARGDGIPELLVNENPAEIYLVTQTGPHRGTRPVKTHKQEPAWAFPSGSPGCMKAPVAAKLELLFIESSCPFGGSASHTKRMYRRQFGWPPFSTAKSEETKNQSAEQGDTPKEKQPDYSFDKL